MTPQAIKAELILRGIRQRDIAARLRVTHPAISNVIAGRVRSDRIREAIARAIGRRVEELWPDSTPVSKFTTPKAASNG